MSRDKDCVIGKYIHKRSLAIILYSVEDKARHYALFDCDQHLVHSEHRTLNVILRCYTNKPFISYFAVAI